MPTNDKIFRIGDDNFVYVVAHSVQQAIVCYLRSEVDAIDLETALEQLDYPVIEISQDQLQRLVYLDIDNDSKCSFAERLAFEQEQGLAVPRIFAQENY